MALATRCPHCNTTFRVAQDQLKLRAGLVRCGTCKEIFNGIEHLLRPDELEDAKLPPLPPGAEEKPAVVDTPADAPANIPAAIPPPAPVVPVSVPASEPAQATPAAPDATPATAEPEPFQAEPVLPNEVSVPAAPSEQVEFMSIEDILAPPNSAAPSTAPSATEQSHQDDQKQNAPVAAQEEDPLQRMTLVNLSDDDQADDLEDDATIVAMPPDTLAKPAEPAAAPAASVPDPIEKAIDNLQRASARAIPPAPAASAEKIEATEAISLAEEVQAPHDEFEEPGFVKRARRKQQFGRIVRLLMSIGSFILLISLVAQASYAFRNEIAAWFPNTKPMLTSACGVVGCRVDLPAQIDAVSIESHELQTLPTNKDMLVLSTLLRNRSTVAQTWPNMELTLNDANGRAIARRVFLPREYLSSPQDAAKGFAAASEQSFKLYFELSQLTPSGYTVYLFYP